jgi:hypothetical protein
MKPEPEIFSNQKPHEVHLAEGSTSALAKKANDLEPQIRHTEVNPDEEEEIIAIADGVSVSQLPEPAVFAHNAPSESPDDLHHAAEENTAPNLSAPAPLAMLMSDLPSLDIAQRPPLPSPPPSADIAAADNVVAAEPTPENDNPPAAPVTAGFMEEMNFPARVVKLKIANDKIRTQIETLEKPLFEPIVQAAPIAKAKGKAETKKPAKGH